MLEVILNLLNMVLIINLKHLEKLLMLKKTLQVIIYIQLNFIMCLIHSIFINYYYLNYSAKIINDESKKDTSCIDFTSASPSYTEAGKDKSGGSNAVLPKYRVCSGLGGCSSDSSCTCQTARTDAYDLDTLGFGRKQKKLYNCLPHKGEDPMEETIETTDIKDGYVKKDLNKGIPFSYFICPESKDGLRCAELTCANYHGYSWFNYPSRYETATDTKFETDKYLPPMLCSGEGVCDSSENNGKGICLCNNGFIGSTCQTCIYLYIYIFSGLSIKIL